MKNKLIFFKNIIIMLWNRHHFIVAPKYWKKYFKAFIRKLGGKKEYLNPFVVKEYNEWLKKQNEIATKKTLKKKPLISFLIPVYNIEPIYLSECLDSILNQSYTNFEICIADDNSTKKETIDILKEYEKKDNRVKVVYRKENGHISKATNSALEIATGEFIALMDDDDILAPDALYKIVEVINKDKNIDFIYTDEDKMDMDGNFCEPHFKTDFAVDSFFGGNYICHFTVINKTLFDEIGGFDPKCVGAQDFDMFLKATEKAKKIHHIPEILYHWRKVPGSTADTIENKDYAIKNGKIAVENALKRRNLDAYVTVPIKCTHYVVHYNCKNKPLVSIIMTDVNKNVLNYNLNQLYKKNTYENIEVIINYNKNIKLKNHKNKNIKFLKQQNINKLISSSKGDYVMLLSGKIKFNDENCIEELVGYASQKEIAAVGPKIYNFGKTIKSAGLVLSSKNIYVDAFQNYFIDSVGVYGRLVVPYNYSALSSNCILFEKDKYKKVNGFLNNVSIDISNIDFCLKLLKEGYRNVLLSHISINQKDINKKQIFEISEKEKKLLNSKWDLDDNTFYNKNLSKEYNFMLDIGENNEK